LRLSDNSVSYQTALVFSRILAFLTLSTYYNQVKSLKSYENTTLKKLSHNFLSYGTASLAYLNLKAQSPSNKNTGTYIGILERLLIFICIVSGFYEGIGYLLAAKSIFRFGDLTKAGHRSMTEYVLIGTLLSFTSAILWSLLYLYLRKNLTNLDILIN
jgi:cyanate permease